MANLYTCFAGVQSEPQLMTANSFRHCRAIETDFRKVPNATVVACYHGEKDDKCNNEAKVSAQIGARYLADPYSVFTAGDIADKGKQNLLIFGHLKEDPEVNNVFPTLAMRYPDLLDRLLIYSRVLPRCLQAREILPDARILWNLHEYEAKYTFWPGDIAAIAKDEFGINRAIQAKATSVLFHKLETWDIFVHFMQHILPKAENYFENIYASSKDLVQLDRFFSEWY